MNASLTRMILRRILPRNVRLALLHPRATGQWLRDSVARELGRSTDCRMRADWSLKCDPASVRAFRQFDTDPTQREELDTFVRYAKPGMILLDGGAHFGAFSLAALRYGGAGAQVVAVDPSPSTTRVLERNLELAEAGDRARVINAALGSTDGTLQMLSAGAGGGNYFVVADDARPDTQEVEQLTLASACQRAGIIPTHVKIDVEGFELEVLQGGRDILATHHPIVFLELHCTFIRNRGQNPADVLNLLQSYGYRSFLEGEHATTIEQATTRHIVRLVCLPA